MKFTKYSIFKYKVLIVTIGSLFVFTACQNPTEPVDDGDKSPYIWVNSVHTNLGVAYSCDTTNDIILVKNQYVVNYNKDLNVPNCVSWEINSSWFGDVSRWSGNFITDTSLPSGIYRVKHSDYTNSGFDRGHMVQSESRTLTVEDNKTTFLMTNILPQTPDLNQGVWYDFEYYCNGLAITQNKELFVIAGGIYRTKDRIKDVVAIPDSCFKIVVVLEKGQSYLDVTDTTPVIAVVMPNIAGVRNADWHDYLTNVDRIESSTCFNYLSKIPKKIQDVIEKKVFTE